MEKTMRKPVNWQDFEKLCKKLWGEIWKCSSIKRNGRAGQNQHGVDIYGVPDGEAEYFGIQCKGKDDYTKAQLTESEIDEEITKALNFEPKLKHFIFATTANKDAAIETYIRKKDIESRKNGNFSIALYSWEDIVDLIEENKNTYDWYVKEVKHISNNSLVVKINGCEKNLELNPKFKKRRIIRKRKDLGALPQKNLFGGMFKSTPLMNQIKMAECRILSSGKKVNGSLIPLQICFYNDGCETFDDYKIIFEIDETSCKFKEDNFENIGPTILSLLPHCTHYFIKDDMIVYDGKEKPLVPKDGRGIECFLVVPKSEQTFKIKYKFLSRSYNTKGEIVVSSVPHFETKVEISEVDEEKDVGENVIIEDLIRYEED